MQTITLLSLAVASVFVMKLELRRLASSAAGALWCWAAFRVCRAGGTQSRRSPADASSIGRWRRFVLVGHGGGVLCPGGLALHGPGVHPEVYAGATAAYRAYRVPSTRGAGSLCPRSHGVDGGAMYSIGSPGASVRRGALWAIDEDPHACPDYPRRCCIASLRTRGEAPPPTYDAVSRGLLPLSYRRLRCAGLCCVDYSRRLHALVIPLLVKTYRVIYGSGLLPSHPPGAPLPRLFIALIGEWGALRRHWPLRPAEEALEWDGLVKRWAGQDGRVTGEARSVHPPVGYAGRSGRSSCGLAAQGFQGRSVATVGCGTGRTPRNAGPAAADVCMWGRPPSILPRCPHRWLPAATYDVVSGVIAEAVFTSTLGSQEGAAARARSSAASERRVADAGLVRVLPSPSCRELPPCLALVVLPPAKTSRASLTLRLRARSLAADEDAEAVFFRLPTSALLSQSLLPVVLPLAKIVVAVFSCRPRAAGAEARCACGWGRSYSPPFIFLGGCVRSFSLFLSRG
ncbi:hypothetical protein B0H15DRAFT_995755 [Mycena belliarum]|uniref:Uncharacterized protein n=1 Tax=Mycena belliarum TaxID=1033014 RepID=A0AAD6UJN6_9AGAR|nr:hypothetical protein B0H15DRAFT_995755 [Mycena belliae]